VSCTLPLGLPDLTRPIRVRAAEHKEAGQSDIIVISAGAPQKEGESRTDLVGKNLKILSTVIEDMKPFKESAILILVANPVDVLTDFAIKYSGLPKTQVFGTGTFLDSARLRGILAKKANVAASSIDAWVLGEHGESQVVAWSTAAIGGVPLSELFSESEIDRKAIAKETKDKAASISESKGATAYGVGSVTASVCKSLLFDQRNVRTVSHYNEEYGCCLSMPAVLGREGIVRTLHVPLSQQEKKDVDASAKEMLKIMGDAEKDQK
jgi:L-lactate dehydrogenase